jgi:hypothetical protein
MMLDNIKVSERYTLYNVEFYTKGFLKGYINAMLEDNQTNHDHEVLYRVFDPANGNENTLVSIDYGWKCNDDTVCIIVEKALLS